MINTNRELKHFTAEKTLYFCSEARDYAIEGILLYSSKNDNDKNHDGIKTLKVIT
jgi:hypothetical protein